MTKFMQKRLVGVVAFLIILMSTENAIPSATATVLPQTLVNGVYYISSKAAPGKVLDVSGGSQDDCGNVHLWDYFGLTHQLWYLRNEGYGYYSLQAVHSQKYLDASGTNEYATVWQYTNNGSDAQRWIIRDAGAGYYSIISKFGYNLDLQNAGTENGTNILLRLGNDSVTQKWEFTLVESENKIQEGTYCISPQIAPDMALDVSGGGLGNFENVQVWNSIGVSNQHWYVKPKGGGYYSLKAVHSGRYLDASGMTDGANVWQYEENNGEAQTWAIRDAGDGYFYVIAYGRYLEVSDASPVYGTNVVIGRGTLLSSQKWRFTPVQTELVPTIGVRLANFNRGYYRSGNPFYNANLAGQCTWYCWGRAYEKCGIQLNTRHNANTWLAELNCPNTSAVYDASKPRTNSIAVYGYNNANHVRFVEMVKDGNVYYTESNSPRDNVIDNNDGIVKITSISNFAKNCMGYIYLNN